MKTGKAGGRLAIIIPVGPKDLAWEALLPDLRELRLPGDTEIVLVGTRQAPRRLATLLRRYGLSESCQWLQAPQGRAKQLNAGAKSTSNEFLWFLHADSRVTPDAFSGLTRSLRTHPGTLHYFNLKFDADGPAFTPLNSLGVWLRSHLLGLPFGDQGFCVSRKVFSKIGEFPEDAPYGEDHLLVWKARKHGVPLRCTGKTLLTSARKYKSQGWARTTSEHLYLTLRQAMPEFRDWVSAAIWEHLP